MGMRSINPIWRCLTDGTIILIATLILHTSVLAISGNTSFNSSFVSAAPLVNDLSHRYIIFLGGIRSFSSGVQSSPINNDFIRIKNQLRQLGIPDSNFIYFSYSAAYHHQQRNVYCAGWGANACSADGRGNLTYLNLSPVYTIDHTKLSIDNQTEALQWLLGQIVDHHLKIQPGSTPQIDLVGFSLGGVVASRWAATVDKTSSPYNKIHSIVLIGSPVGGVPLAEPITKNCIVRDDPESSIACWLVWRPILGHLFGEKILEQLQLELPGENTLSDSIVDSLFQATQNFPGRVTSIENSNDYLVNGQSFFLCADPISICKPELALRIPVGNGAQIWNMKEPFVPLRANLGGQLVPDTDPVPKVEILYTLGGPILKNHNLSLTNPQTALWVMAAIRGDDQEQLPVLTPDGTICGQLKWATSCGEGLVKGQQYLFIPCRPSSAYLWQPLHGFSPNDYDRFFRVVSPVFETIESPQCSNEYSYVTAKLASWSDYQPIDSCGVCEASLLPPTPTPPSSTILLGEQCGQFIWICNHEWPVFLPAGSNEPWVLDPEIFHIFTEGGFARIDPEFSGDWGPQCGYPNVKYLLDYYDIAFVSGCGTTAPPPQPPPVPPSDLSHLRDQVLSRVRASSIANVYPSEAERFVDSLLAHLDDFRLPQLGVTKDTIIAALQKDDVGDRMNGVVNNVWANWGGRGDADPSDQSPFRQLVIRMIQGRQGTLTDAQQHALHNFFTRSEDSSVWRENVNAVIGAVNRESFQMEQPTPIATSTATPVATPQPSVAPINLEMITIPAGNFTMGSSDADIQAAVAECNATEGSCKEEWFGGEKPARTVFVDAFKISKYEITNAQYNACVNTGVCQVAGRSSADSSIPYKEDYFADDFPVVGIGWHDANAFCTWIGGRLPTEEEWEKAARGASDQRRYPWGNEFDPSKANLATGFPSAVGSYPDGASLYGVIDMTGNVFEWTATPADGRYVIRGGAWSKDYFRGRVTDRGTKLSPGFANYDIGFRCVSQ